MLFALSLLLFPIVLGVLILAIVKSRKSRRWLWLVAGTVFIEGLCVERNYREFHHWDGVELNIRPTEDEIVGRWSSMETSITFKADRTYQTSPGAAGRWHLKPEGLVEAGGHTFVPIRRDGELQMIRDGLVDPDEWYLPGAYKKMPASAQQQGANR